jgi:hypothetical protein
VKESNQESGVVVVEERETDMHEHEMSDARDHRNFSGDEVEEVEEDPERVLANKREDFVLLQMSFRSESELWWRDENERGGQWDLILKTEWQGDVVANDFANGSMFWICSSNDLVEDDVASEEMIGSLGLSIREALGGGF